MNLPLAQQPFSTALVAFWQWLMASPGQPPQAQRSQPGKRAVALASLQSHVHPATAPKQVPQVTTRQRSDFRVFTQPVAQQPLRVVRLLEAGQPPSLAGRLRISGRMADVCAELDRLAACEGRMH